MKRYSEQKKGATKSWNELYPLSKKTIDLYGQTQALRFAMLSVQSGFNSTFQLPNADLRF